MLWGANRALLIQNEAAWLTGEEAVHCPLYHHHLTTQVENADIPGSQVSGTKDVQGSE